MTHPILHPTLPLALGVALLAAGPARGQRLDRPEALRLEGEATEQVELLRGDSPEQHYPAAARRESMDGVVEVDVLLNAEGQVLEAQVVSESPPGMGFALAALDTAKTFEFSNPLKRLVLLSLTLEFLP